MSEIARLSLQYDLNNVSSTPKGEQSMIKLPIFGKSVFCNIIWPTELLTLAIWLGFQRSYKIIFITVLGLLFCSFKRCREYYMMWEMASNDIKVEHKLAADFVVHLSFYFVVSLVIIACLSKGNFTNLNMLGTISIGSIFITIVLFLHYTDIKCIHVHEALGTSNIPEDVVDDLKYAYPKGVNTDRIQFLLHDTLKQEPWTFPRKECTQQGYFALVCYPILVLPKVLDRADEEGNLPFQLACQYSPVRVVSLMVKLDKDRLNIRDARGNNLMHYACQGENYKVIDYLMASYLVTKRNNDGDLPVYVLSSCSCKVDDDPQRLETIWKLLLANPEDMNMKEKLPSTLIEQAVVSEDEAVPSEPSLKPQRHLSLLLYIILVVVNLMAAVYIGTLRSISTVSQQKYHSEVKRLVDELVESQNEMNLLRTRMDALKYAQNSLQEGMAGGCTAKRVEEEGRS